jgi:predicted molibdopterin-dependent oxidoreductase YjgC
MRGPDAKNRGKFVVTNYVPTDEKTGPRFPLLLTTGRILSHTMSEHGPGGMNTVERLFHLINHIASTNVTS